MKKLLLSIVLFTLSISCFAQDKINYNWEISDFSNTQPERMKPFSVGFSIHSLKNENNILTLNMTPIFGVKLSSSNKDLNCSFCTVTVVNQFNKKENFEMQLNNFNPPIYNILDKPRLLKFISTGKFSFVINNSYYDFKPSNNISSFAKTRDFSYWITNDPFWNTIYPSFNISYSQVSLTTFPSDAFSVLMFLNPSNKEEVLAYYMNEANFSCGQICNIKINTASGSFEVQAFNFAKNTNSSSSYIIISNPRALMMKIKSLNQNNPIFSITVPTIEKGNLTFKFNISEY